MKKSSIIFGLVLLLNLFQSFSAKAALVTIPDANFRTYLKTTYPTCFVGDDMETTCSGIVNATYMNIDSKNIANLSGIEYFTKLYSFSCALNQLSTISTIPNSVRQFVCKNNQLTLLPPLPPLLNSLDCSHNPLTILPSLPTSLTSIHVLATN